MPRQDIRVDSNTGEVTEHRTSQRTIPGTVVEQRAKYVREILLENARQAISGDRDKQYGGPEDNFRQVASLWKVAFPERDWSPSDIALAQTLLKTARLITGGYEQEDTWTDVAGYAACGWEVSKSEGS